MQYEVQVICAVVCKHSLLLLKAVKCDRQERVNRRGGITNNFCGKLKTLSCTRDEGEQHRALQLEAAAGLGESCGVGHGQEELGWW